MPKLTPNLWFDGQAEEAANYYVSIFKNSRVMNVSRYGDTGPGPEGSALVVTFSLDGQDFAAINGGPEFTFSEAISFQIDCADQDEVDYFWEKLSEGGRKDQCGWLKDKYGLSWQVVPTILEKLMTDKDPAKTNSVMRAMMQMAKLDIAGLKAAYEQE